MGSLDMHFQIQHAVAKVVPVQEEEVGGRGNEPRAYRMEFPTRVGPRHCLVEGCSGRLSTRTAMRVHFWNRHFRYTVVILEKGNLPYPRCPLCNMMVPWQSLNGSHNSTEDCKKGS